MHKIVAFLNAEGRIGIADKRISIAKGYIGIADERIGIAERRINIAEGYIGIAKFNSLLINQMLY